VRRLVIILTVAAIAAIIHIRAAAILTYFSAVWSGDADPSWPHGILLGISLMAGAVVTVGIVYEAVEYKEHSLHRVAKWLVIWGVVVESFCTVALFVFDERISNAQQSKIIALETRIAARHLDEDQRSIIAKALRNFPSPEFDLCVTPGVEEDFVTELRETLVAGGWKVRSFGNKLAKPEELLVPEGKIPGIAVCGATGVNIWMDPALGPKFSQSAALVRLALSKIGIAASAYTMETDEHERAEIVHVQIGSRL